MVGRHSNKYIARSRLQTVQKVHHLIFSYMEVGEGGEGNLKRTNVRIERRISPYVSIPVIKLSQHMSL
jgi:hypothetical protein